MPTKTPGWCGRKMADLGAFKVRTPASLRLVGSDDVKLCQMSTERRGPTVEYRNHNRQIKIKKEGP